MKVAVVIVTYNRLELLKQSLAAIFEQTLKPDIIHIVDNCSEDGTRAFLSELQCPACAIHFLTENMGGAGGFKVGIEAAYSDSDYIWCMDDDCIPNQDALSQLLEHEKLISMQQREVGFLCSRVLWCDGELAKMNMPVAHRCWIQPHSFDVSVSRVLGASFVSLLISSAAVKRVGLPVGEFFIWFDDAEYTRRISSHFECYYVSSSVVSHLTKDNIYPMDFNYLTDDSLWKFCYGIRNEMSFYWHGGSYVSAMLFSLKLILSLFRLKKFRFLYSVIISLFKGIFFNYKKYIKAVG